MRGVLRLTRGLRELVRERVAVERGGVELIKASQAAREAVRELERFTAAQGRRRSPVQGPLPPVPATMPGPLELDLRPYFRQAGRAFQPRVAAALAAAGFQDEARRIARASLLRVRRSGYGVKVHELGQVLTWVTRGTKERRRRKDGASTGAIRGRGRVAIPSPNLNELAAGVARLARRAFEAWQPR